MLVTPDEIQAIEAAIFATGVTAESLMDAVGRAVAEHLARFDAGTLLVYAGKGNNAGDVLVAARELARLTGRNGRRFQIRLRLAADGAAALGDLARKKLDALDPDEFPRLTGEQARAVPADGGLMILDGLLGIGARGALREPIKGAAREINDLRPNAARPSSPWTTPPGWTRRRARPTPIAVVADETLTVGFPKAGLVADRATNHVGKLHVIALPEFTRTADAAPARPGAGDADHPGSLAGLLPPRPHESNKGMFGRVGILAGSVGATGAAVMCSHACARAGAGLITLLVQKDIYPIVAAMAAPEVMVKPLASPLDALDMNFDVLALGPGLGQTGTDRVRTLIERWPKPMVIDADGLNALAEDIRPLLRGAGPRLLTPHPGEMKRLLKGDAVSRGAVFNDHASRADTARAFTDYYPVTLLLKGARTIIAERGRPPAYNSTGNAGMATGGMGDLLTGICAAMLGQKLSPWDAARLASWLHGRAADLARQDGQSQESLLPTDLFPRLGAGFEELRAAGTA